MKIEKRPRWSIRFHQYFKNLARVHGLTSEQSRPASPACSQFVRRGTPIRPRCRRQILPIWAAQRVAKMLEHMAVDDALRLLERITLQRRQQPGRGGQHIGGDRGGLLQLANRVATAEYSFCQRPPCIPWKNSDANSSGLRITSTSTRQFLIETGLPPMCFRDSPWLYR